MIKPHYPPTPSWATPDEPGVPLDKAAALQWAIEFFRLYADYLKPGGRQSEELKARVRTIRGGFDEFHDYEEISYSIQQADQGDEAAKTVLLETAALHIERGLIEYSGPLKDFVIRFLRNPKPPKPKRGRKRGSLSQRDTFISSAVDQIHRRWGFSPTRNSATRDKGHPSAASIVMDALSNVRAAVSEDEIVKIWTAKNSELDRWKKSRGIK